MPLSLPTTPLDEEEPLHALLPAAPPRQVKQSGEARQVTRQVRTAEVRTAEVKTAGEAVR